MSKGDQAKQDERAAEKAAREAAWWVQWREHDYSWAGLAALDDDGTPEKRWIGWSVTPDGRCVETATAPERARPATRQDYLRRDSATGRLRTDKDLRNAGLLVKDKGQVVFHILHLPPSHADGSPSFKADLNAPEWQTLETEVDRLIRLGRETDADVVKAEFAGTDNRTELSGAILRRFPRPPAPEKDESEPAALHLAANFTAWLADADASGLEFGSSLLMHAAMFLGSVDFTDAQFSGGGAYFYEAQFSGGGADFWGAVFGLQRLLPCDLGLPHDTGFWIHGSRDALFDQAEFTRGAIFLATRFLGEASFRGARFAQSCEFGRADQHGSGSDVRPGADFQFRLSLRGASFKGLADFSRVRFPARAEDRNSAFEGARFFEPLDFKGVAVLPFSAFHGIRLDQGILLDSDHPDPGQFETALKAAEEAAVRDAAFATAKNPDPDAERRGRDKRFAALEAGCRALKTAMAEENDRAREQVFYTFELRAREHRFDRSAVSDQQRPLSLAGYRFSRLYGAVANYGTSVSRPLIRLGWLTLGFAALNLLILAIAMLSGSVAAENWVWWALDAPFHPSLTDTLGLAFKNALGPLRVLAGNGDAFDHLGDRAPVFTGLMLVSTLTQGLASSALIFLSLLALRRQFQIN